MKAFWTMVLAATLALASVVAAAEAELVTSEQPSLQRTT